MPNLADGSARVICLGLTTLDRIWRVTEIPATPRKCAAQGFEEAGGGMAATGAVTAARLGGRVAMWSRVGTNSTGATLREGLEREGVDVSNVRRFEGACSPTSAVLVDRNGERLLANFRGQDLPSDPSWLPLDEVAGAGAVLADVRWPEGAAALLAAARRFGVPSVLDAETGAAAAFPTLLPLVDYAIFSINGLADFVPGVMEDALAAARRLGTPHAGVTLGEQGYLWCDDAGLHRFPAFNVPVVDTNGAGDAFHGAFVLALAEGRGVQECVRMASAAAAIKCMHASTRAGLPDRATLERFLATHAPP